MGYIFGIILTLLSETIISIANVLDGKLSRITFSSVWSLVAINGLLIIPVLPILYFIFHPKFLNPDQLIIVAIIAAIEVFYQIPYYGALRETDTSVVMSLFNLEKIAIPILAYFVVGERLYASQYLGFGLIIGCSLLTTATKKAKINKALYYMLVVCAILAIEAVLEKYSLNQLRWQDFYFWMMTFSVPFYLSILLFGKMIRKEVYTFISSPFDKKYIPLYIQNIATIVATGIGTIALSILPVTINEGIESFHVVIVYLVATFGQGRFQLAQKEDFSLRRFLIFVMISVGAVLIILGHK